MHISLYFLFARIFFFFSCISSHHKILILGTRPKGRLVWELLTTSQMYRHLHDATPVENESSFWSDFVRWKLNFRRNFGWLKSLMLSNEFYLISFYVHLDWTLVSLFLYLLSKKRKKNMKPKAWKRKSKFTVTLTQLSDSMATYTEIVIHSTSK